MYVTFLPVIGVLSDVCDQIIIGTTSSPALSSAPPRPLWLSARRLPPFGTSDSTMSCSPAPLRSCTDLHTYQAAEGGRTILTNLSLGIIRRMTFLSHARVGGNLGWSRMLVRLMMLQELSMVG